MEWADGGEHMHGLVHILPNLRVFTWRTIMLHDNPVQCTLALLDVFRTLVNEKRVCERRSTSTDRTAPANRCNTSKWK